jgi:nucleoside-diphosphate-sugar epimerase
MASILVTGSNGFVGSAFCTEAARRGYKIRAAQRAIPNSQNCGYERIEISHIDSDTDWSDALKGCDSVVHLASRVHVMRDHVANPLEEFRKINVAGTERLARSAAACGVKRLVFVSSIKVNGESTLADRKFLETDEPSPHDPYAISKCETESILHRVSEETGLEIVIVRPPLVYGAGVKGNLVQMLNVLAKDLPLPLASVRNLRSLVYVENLVDALILCTTHPAAAGQTYLVSDGDDVSTPDLLRHLGVPMGHPARLIPCPMFILNLAGHISGKSAQIERLVGSLQVDSTKIRRELNWTPPYNLQQGLHATAQWYRNNFL